jgi:wobble nucleotide-excising tRNase
MTANLINLSSILKSKLTMPATNPLNRDDFNSKKENFQKIHSENDLIIDKINSLIIAHNQDCDNFIKKIDSARKSILFSKLSEIKPKYIALEGLLIESKKKFDEADKIHQEKAKEILEIKNELSNIHDVAEEINSTLKEFGHEHIKLIPKDGGNYSITRYDFPAKNLSEGERTALALSYFIASLNEEGFSIHESLIVLDDPISSLDQNSLYYTASLIKKMVGNANQIIILTHNYDFFREVFKWFKAEQISYNKKNSSAKKDIVSTYMLKRTKAENGNFVSKITRLDSLFHNYDSEYNYFFITLLKYINKPEDRLEVLYTLPNIARKVLEVFISFKFPQHINHYKDAFADEDIELSEVEKEHLKRLLDIESHTKGVNSLTTFSSGTANELDAQLLCLMRLIKSLDEGHYLAMCKMAKVKENMIDESVTQIAENNETRVA